MLRRAELGLEFHSWGWPCGIAVKYACSAAGGLGSDPGLAPMHRLSGHAVAVFHIKWRKMGMDVKPGPGFFSKNRRIGNGC